MTNLSDPAYITQIMWSDFKSAKGTFCGNLACCYPVLKNIIELSYDRATVYRDEIGKYRNYLGIKLSKNLITVDEYNSLINENPSRTVIFRTQHRLVLMLFRDTLKDKREIEININT